MQLSRLSEQGDKPGSSVGSVLPVAAVASSAWGACDPLGAVLSQVERQRVVCRYVLLCPSICWSVASWLQTDGRLGLSKDMHACRSLRMGRSWCARTGMWRGAACTFQVLHMRCYQGKASTATSLCL